MTERIYLITVKIRMERLFIVEAENAPKAYQLARIGNFIGHKDTLDYDWDSSTVIEETEDAPIASQDAPVFKI